MPLIATGVNKLLAIKRQTAQGVYTPATGGRYLRRVTSSLDKNKATYASNEMKKSQQVGDFRHGVANVSGAINGELSVGGYQEFMESMLRQNALEAVEVAGLGDLELTAGVGSLGTIKTTAGSFATLKPGMVIRAVGFADNAGMNGTNLLIVSIAVGSKSMIVLRLDKGTVPTDAAETGSVTLTSVGKHTFVPQSGQTRDYYMIEHYYSDITESELYKDCVVSQMDVALPPSGLATINFSLMGLDMEPATGSDQLTTPSDAGTGAILAAANGALILDGKPVALITGMNFSAKGGHTTIGGVVGSDLEPDIFPGTFTADGQATVLFQSAEVRDLFLNETEVTLIGCFTSNKTGTADFTSFAFPRVKFGGAAKDDGNKGLVMTMPFTAIENLGNNEKGFHTTMMVQDSLFV